MSTVHQPPRESPHRDAVAETAPHPGPGSGLPRDPTVPRQPQRRNWLMIAAVTVTMLVIGLFYYQSTSVSGLELNSHTWEQREFSFRRDPLTGWQLGGVRHNAPVRVSLWTTAENPRSKKMAPSILKYFATQPTAPLRWDLIQLDDSALPGARASILVELLASLDQREQALWPGWTAQHPERAAVLWPAAQRLVAADQYTWLPHLFEQAMLENSTEDFSRSAGQLVTTALDVDLQKTLPAQSTSSAEVERPVQDRQP